MHGLNIHQRQSRAQASETKYNTHTHTQLDLSIWKHLPRKLYIVYKEIATDIFKLKVITYVFLYIDIYIWYVFEWISPKQLKH